MRFTGMEHLSNEELVRKAELDDSALVRELLARMDMAIEAAAEARFELEQAKEELNNSEVHSELEVEKGSNRQLRADVVQLKQAVEDFRVRFDERGKEIAELKKAFADRPATW